MMKTCIAICACLPLLLLGCSQGAESEQAQQQARPVAAGTAAAPVPEQPDTVLQPVTQLALRALGNTLEEVRFDQDTLEAPAGAKVNITLVNEATDMPIYHNVVITLPNTYKAVAQAGAKIGSPGNYVPQSPAVIAASPLALPGQTVHLEFTAPKAPGTYAFVCSYPDHWQRMHGTFLVK